MYDDFTSEELDFLDFLCYITVYKIKDTNASSNFFKLLPRT